MTNKTKPVYLIIAGILISFVVIIFAFLIIQTRNTIDTTISESTVETQSKPRTSYKNRVNYTEPTEETVFETTSETSVDNVIRAKGLYRDKKDKVYDSDKNKYEVIDGNVFIVYQGNLHKIPVEELEVVQPTEKSKKKKQKATEPPKAQSENTSSQNNYYSGSSNSSTSVKQPNNIVKPTTSTSSKKPSKNNVRMSYSSLAVQKGETFSLALSGATSGVHWSVDGYIVEILSQNGSHCVFTAKNCGSVSVLAQHNGNTYSCYVTIS